MIFMMIMVIKIITVIVSEHTTLLSHDNWVT